MIPSRFAMIATERRVKAARSENGYHRDSVARGLSEVITQDRGPTLSRAVIPDQIERRKPATDLLVQTADGFSLNIEHTEIGYSKNRADADIAYEKWLKSDIDALEGRLSGLLGDSRELTIVLPASLVVRGEDKARQFVADLEMVVTSVLQDIGNYDTLPTHFFSLKKYGSTRGEIWLEHPGTSRAGARKSAKVLRGITYQEESECTRETIKRSFDRKVSKFPAREGSTTNILLLEPRGVDVGFRGAAFAHSILAEGGYPALHEVWMASTDDVLWCYTHLATDRTLRDCLHTLTWHYCPTSELSMLMAKTPRYLGENHPSFSVGFDRMTRGEDRRTQ